jgi:hypothetical protein
MRRKVYALFTDSGSKFEALIFVFAPVFVGVSVLYSNIVFGGDNKNTAAAGSTPNPQKQNCGGGGGGSGGGGSSIWSIVLFVKLLLPHLVKKLLKFHGAQTSVNQLSI